MAIIGASQVGTANGHYGQCHKDQKEDETFEIMHLMVILSIGAFFRRLLGEIGCKDTRQKPRSQRALRKPILVKISAEL